MGEMVHYESYFAPGLKVGVGIPLPNADVFFDWALIYEIDEDLVILQLSRDQLPVNVSLHVGQILELRGKQGNLSYSCRAIIVFEGRAREIVLRLIGEIVTDEHREFYRIDAFLPIKYFISPEQHIDVLSKQWQERRLQRMEDELVRKQQRWDNSYIVDKSQLPKERRQEPSSAELAEPDDSWDTIIPLAASISGGGIRIVAHEEFSEDQLVPLEIMVPQPRRIIDAIGRVVFVNRNYAASTDRPSYNVAMKFVCIDERDRDAVVNHIANVQLKRIRQLRESYLMRNLSDEESGPMKTILFKWLPTINNILLAIVLLVVLAMLVIYFRDYTVNQPKSEIGETFENSIRNYLKKIGK